MTFRMGVSKGVLLFLLPLWVGGCSARNNDNVPPRIRKMNNLHAYPADARPAHPMAFTRDASYGDTPDVVVGDISAVAVSSSGRVFVGNSDQGVFYVYAPDGTYLTQMGGKGKGPGEFARFISPTVQSDTLYAYDISQQRISMFSTDSLRVINTLNLGAANQATIKALRPLGLHHVYPWINGTFLANFSPNHIAEMDPDSLSQKYFLINANGNVISHQIFARKGLGIGLLATRFGGRWHGAGFKFIPRSLVAISKEHHIFAAWTADFLIKEYDPEGHYRQAFYYPFQKIPLTEDEALELQKDRGDTELAKYLQNILRHVEIPSTWPALYALKVDDHRRLWVATFVKNQDIYQWWVLNEQGKLLARFNWPRDKEIETIKGGHLYTRETDAKGVPRIVRYKIQMQ